MIAASTLDYRELARRRLPHFLSEYIDGGSYAEVTLRRNIADLEAIALRQRECPVFPARPAKRIRCEQVWKRVARHHVSRSARKLFDRQQASTSCSALLERSQ